MTGLEAQTFMRENNITYAELSKRYYLNSDGSKRWANKMRRLLFVCNDREIPKNLAKALAGRFF
jgi:hypothetical protein